MADSRVPGLYYNEDVSYESTGEGSKIPVIIGVTGNTYDEENNPNYNPNGKQIIKYSGWSEVNKPCNSTDPGVCPKTTQQNPDTSYTDETIKTAPNQLARFLHEFFVEARIQSSEDLGVPYIYVIDVGTGEKAAWVNALKTAKTKLDATIEFYLGCDNITGYTIKEFLDAAEAGIKTELKLLDLRTGFTTKGYLTPETVTDEQLIALTNATTGNRYSRIGIMEPLLAGKTFARICCTPAEKEPGFYEYRSVDPGTFKDRSLEQIGLMQNNGIIINRDEHVNANIHPKINLCVSTAYPENPKPADARFHARFNSDDLLREIFEVSYPLIKDNDAEVGITYAQTAINKLINDRVNNDEFVKYNERTGKGTRLIISSIDDSSYCAELSGQMQPKKSIDVIEINAKLII